MQIKILHKQGKSLCAIDCELECSTNTVGKYRQGERTVRQLLETLRSKPVPELLVRFETALGDQMQVDCVKCS